MPSHPHARKRSDGTTRDFGLQPPHASPLPLQQRGVRRAKAPFCQLHVIDRGELDWIQLAWVIDGEHAAW